MHKVSIMKKKIALDLGFVIALEKIEIVERQGIANYSRWLG